VDKTGIEEFVTQNVSIYPNPTNENITIVWSGEVTFIEITDTKVKVLKRITQISGGEESISLGNYA
tara:strand:- start:1279 stop:1476 length:198 start_codon:yes stop_codon:yes gene_type:complete